MFLVTKFSSVLPQQYFFIWKPYLTPCGLVMLYSNTDLCQQYIAQVTHTRCVWRLSYVLYRTGLVTKQGPSSVRGSGNDCLTAPSHYQKFKTIVGCSLVRLKSVTITQKQFPSDCPNEKKLMKQHFTCVQTLNFQWNHSNLNAYCAGDRVISV